MLARHVPHIALTLALAGATLVCAEPPGLRDQMPEQQFRELGLHKLSAPELQALEQWIAEQWIAEQVVPEPGLVESESTAPAVLIDSAPSKVEATGTTAATTPPVVDSLPEDFGLIVKPTAAEDARKLYATVLEPFNGWQGKTIFKLDNGQIWKQRGAGKYNYRGDDNRVVITKNAWGFYEMRLQSVDRAAGVKRLK